MVANLLRGVVHRTDDAGAGGERSGDAAGAAERPGLQPHPYRPLRRVHEHAERAWTGLPFHRRLRAGPVLSAARPAECPLRYRTRPALPGEPGECPTVRALLRARTPDRLRGRPDQSA